MNDEAVEDPERAMKAYAHGRTLIEKGHLSEGISYLHESAAAFPHFKTYEVLGETLLKMGDTLDAILYLSAAAGIGNRPFRAKYLLAHGLLKWDPLAVDDARRLLEEAIALQPDYRAAKELLASLPSPPGES